MMSGVARFPIGARADWLAMRREDVTASTVGALFGVHDFVSPFALFALKTEQTTEEQVETPAMRRGRLLEDDALQVLQEDAERDDSGRRFEKGQFYYRDVARRIGATPDAFCDDPKRGRGIVQIKTISPWVLRKKWLKDGELDVPPWIAMQAIVEAKLTGCTWAAVAAARVENGFEVDLLEIPLKEQYWRAICEKVAEFWRRVAARNPYPPDYGRDAELIARLNPIEPEAPPKDLSTDNELPGLLDELLAARAAEQDGKARVEAAKAAIVHKLGGCSMGICADGRLAVRTPGKTTVYDRTDVVKKITRWEKISVREPTHGRGT